MDPFTPLLGALGIGLQLFGASEQADGAKAQAAAAAKYNKEQSKYYDLQEKSYKKEVQIAKSNDKIENQAKIAARDASIKAETARYTQMELDSARQKRDIIRQASVARGETLARGAAQGTQQSDSGMQSAIGFNTSQQTFNERSVNQNVSIGKDIFAANTDMAKALSYKLKKYYAPYIRPPIAPNGVGAAQSANGAMMSNVGNSVIGGIDTITRLGTYASNSLFHTSYGTPS